MARSSSARAAAPQELSKQVLELLDPRAGPLPAPVRSVLFGEERFHQHGISLARAQPIERRHTSWPRMRARPFFPRLHENLSALRRARTYIETLDASGEALSPAAEWLLDNFHLIEAQLPEVRTGMSRDYYAQLPKLRCEALRGLPRVYGIAWAFVAHTDSSFDAGLLARFLRAYQEVDELTLGELWALPATLRVVLLENLARLAERVAGHRAAREAANWCCDREATLGAHELQALFARIGERGAHTAFLAQMVLRLQAAAPLEVSPASRWLDAQVADASAALQAAQGEQAADDVSVGNAVTALRAIDNLNWVDLIGQVSSVLQLLHGSPAFRGDSELTRDQATHAIERLARRLDLTESEVARRVLALCEREPQRRAAAPAYWLIGGGRTRLIEALGGNAAAAQQRGIALLVRWRWPLYAGALALCTVLLLRGLMHGRWPGNGMEWTALALLALPALQCAITVVHRLLAESVPVQRLPRLALDDGLQPGHATLVVIPCMLGSPAAVQGHARQLEQHYLANPERHTRFALLSDWTDAPQQEMPGDKALLDAARAGIEELNRRHGDARFLLLHRPRAWCASEGVWMGWERKRGKLEQLLAQLAGGAARAASPFLDLGEASHLPGGTHFVIVLDSDTDLPPGALREMVAVAAHPLNAPRIDPDTRRVVEGYGILQPHVATPFPAPQEITAFGWLSSAPWGTDAYNGGSSEVYQDVFQEGSFCGKGLLNVQAVHDVLHGRVGENRLLSHDLFEGVWTRCGYLSDVTVLESHPMHPDVAASREHRWTRGDWQLLPFLGAALRARVGALNLWKVLDNVRRSLLAPACVALLWWSFASRGVAPAVAVAAVFAALGLGHGIGALATLVPSRGHVAWNHFLREGALSVGRAVGLTLWQFATLLQTAGLRADAIARAVWRMTVSHSGLLEWTTAEQAHAAARADWAGTWRRHRCVTLGAVAWAPAGLALPQASAPWLLAVGMLWAATPLWVWAGAQPLRARRPEALRDEDLAYLRELARDTWGLFEASVGADDHHLPPDNLQTRPQLMLAHRTSPTNIGLYLASCACAQRLGFIDAAELAQRLRRAMDSLDALPRYHGHLYNWIDTRTLQPLAPRYVSSVDSGNLVAALWMTAQACRELAQHEPASAPALQSLAVRLDAFAANVDFRLLYDRQRRLLRIGYRPDDAALDASYYDLLASEARLTSFAAIAKGDLPRRHWEALGRPFLSVRGQPALRSWAGSMFEYLMPSLLMADPPGTLLQRVGVAAVQAQREFGDAHGMPWGVSECAYFAQDRTLAFQYAPFGVPALALRRTPPEDRVVAPYATALAALVDPQAALANFRALALHGARGRYGFIEALDFSRPRASTPGAAQPVATFMAHHQGMTLLALTNLLCEEAPRGWFGRAPLPRSHAALLQERMPREIVLQSGVLPRPPQAPREAAQGTAVREIELDHGAPAWAPTLLLGNGAYSVSLRPSGAGRSSWRGRTVSRSRDDALRDAYGTWLMLRCAGEPAFHSLTRAPHARPGSRHVARFFDDHAQFDTCCAEFEAQLLVWVSPDDDVEFRRVELHNLRDEEAQFELLSVFEAVLAVQAADESHPAFSNLFVQAHALEPHALLLERRPRLTGESGMWAAHFVAACDCALETVQVSCDRAQLLPRLGTLAQLRPHAAATPLPEGRLDTGLDPVASLAVRVRVPAHARRSFTLATAAAEAPETLVATIDEYRQDVHLTRSRTMAAMLTRIRLRELGIAAAELHAIQDLTTPMLASLSRPRAAPTAALDRRALWRCGISGDRPIAVVRIGAHQGLGAVRTLLAAHRMWEIAGLATDLVIVNGEPSSYLMPLQLQIDAMRHALGADAHAQPERGGVYVLRQPELSPAELAALHAYARIDLVADGRPLARLLAQQLRQQPRAGPATALPAAQPPAGDEIAHGRFDANGSHFTIELDTRRTTPRPWANVIANPQFGCLVTEAGGGFTWAHNSRMNQLSGWSNDALLDPPAEHFLVCDEATREVFGLLPTLERNGSAGYRVTHTQGLSSFTHRRASLMVDVRVSVHPSENAKCLHVRLRSSDAVAHTLRMVGLVEWIMGAQRCDRMTLVTEYVPEVQALLARQLEHQGGFGEGTAFLMLDGLAVRQWTCERGEFFAADGRLALPDDFGGAHGFGLDPCAALDAQATLPPHGELEFSWVIGHAAGREAAIALARRLRAPGVLAACARFALADWDRRLSAVNVHTPDPLFDALVNRWLLYQTVACRLWARAGFYQASGATGFRDQLQDAMALAYAEPGVLRAQILLHATRQFPEGDVQHWWHAPSGAGVRARFCDDLLWLPYVLHHYLDVCSDAAVLDEPLPFLEGPPVPPGADDRYDTPTVGGQTASLYEHAARAIDLALRVGAHGLPLIGCGDWNDGMNRVGHDGRGESVWLGWFLLGILRDWIARALERGDAARAGAWGVARRRLAQAIRTHGWDGQWYRRAYFDNGAPLGSHLNDECRIDLIAQAWSVFVDGPGDARARQAMAQADARLVDRRHGLVRLLDPPLQHAPNNAGYIQAYPCGVRENGGQYSHAAVWALIAQARLGRADLAWDYFRWLSPAHRTAVEAGRRRYAIEPYVMPGDVYSAPPHEGRGGWSWYSGSAAWLYRAAVESILGLTLRGERLCLHPCLPPEWPQARLTLRLRGKVLEVLLGVTGRASAPPDARRIGVGEWVDLAALAGPCTLFVEVPAGTEVEAAPITSTPTACRPSA